jgi:hypothetical protein
MGTLNIFEVRVGFAFQLVNRLIEKILKLVNRLIRYLPVNPPAGLIPTTFPSARDRVGTPHAIFLFIQTALFHSPGFDLFSGSI